MSRRLFHFTCKHSVEAIVRDGNLIRPLAQILDSAAIDSIEDEAARWQTRLAWFTIAGRCHPASLGINRRRVCDRGEYRLTVKAGTEAMPWTAYRASHDVPEGVAFSLEGIGEPNPLRPDLWWVSETPLRVLRIDAMPRLP